MEDFAIPMNSVTHFKKRKYSSWDAMLAAHQPILNHETSSECRLTGPVENIQILTQFRQVLAISVSILMWIRVGPVRATTGGHCAVNFIPLLRRRSLGNGTTSQRDGGLEASVTVEALGFQKT